MSVEIVPLDAARLQDYKTIRLEALLNAPDAFSSDFDEEMAQTDSYHLLRLQSSVVYGAYDQGNIIGMIGVIYYPARKMRHRAAIWGVYVAKESRKGGVGRALMDHALAAMPEHVKYVTLGVGTHNTAAIDLYKAMGFEEYGLEKMALIDGDQIYDEHLMVKFL